MEEALDCVRVTVTVTAEEQYGVVAEEEDEPTTGLTGVELAFVLELETG